MGQIEIPIYEGEVPAQGVVDGAMMNEEDLVTTPVHERARAIAFIVDDEVAEIIFTDDRLSAVFLSDPKIVEITSLMSDPLLHPATGWGYDSDTNSFIGRDSEDNVVSLPLA
jgi:hypothetical protein